MIRTLGDSARMLEDAIMLGVESYLGRGQLRGRNMRIGKLNRARRLIHLSPALSLNRGSTIR